MSFFFVFNLFQVAECKSLPPNKPNLLLITIDTLRPDHLGCYGYKSIKTPNIDQLAQDGVLFTQSYSPVPLTLPSHVTIMTGQYPSRHGVHDNGIFVLTDSANTLAEILHAQGYVTGAIISSFVLASSFGLKQGFDYYNDYFNLDQREISKNIESSRSCEAVAQIAQRWLKENEGNPFFLWLHFFDPHAPYQPPAPFDLIYKNQPYDGEIAYLDQVLGQFFGKMQQLRLWENTCIIFVGDHGEGLWEHEEQTHGLFIYDTTIKVPLIFHYPDHFKKGNRVDSLVRTVDIMPTILNIFEVESTEPKEFNFQGVNLDPLLTGKQKKIKLDLYCASQYPELNFNWAPLEGIVTHDGWKYINAPKLELYDLKKDHREKINLFSTQQKKAEAMSQKLGALKKDFSLILGAIDNSNSTGQSKQIALSPEIREKLHSLGYIRQGGTGKKEAAYHQFPHSLPDPKDKAPLLAKIDKARELETDGLVEEAIHKYEEVLKIDPDNKMAHYSLGLAYRTVGKLNEAVVEIKAVTNQDPGYFNCYNILGLLYDQLALPKEAIKAYQKALQFDTNLANIHNNLGMVYLKSGDLDKAIKEFQQVLSLSPGSILASITHANLGGVYLRQGLMEDAVKEFIDSINLNQNNREAHLYLADTYHHIGNVDRAIDERKKILEIWPDDSGSCFKLAQLFLSYGQPKESVIYLQKCLQLMPEFIEARILLQRISQNIISN